MQIRNSYGDKMKTTLSEKDITKKEAFDKAVSERLLGRAYNMEQILRVVKQAVKEGNLTRLHHSAKDLATDVKELIGIIGKI